MFETYKDKKKLELLGKHRLNYEGIRNEICVYVYEQKAIKIGEFNEAKEKQVKERIEKRNTKRREVAKQYKLLKKKRIKNRKKIRKQRKNCEVEWDIWTKSSKTLKNIRKNPKKCQKQYLRYKYLFVGVILV